MNRFPAPTRSTLILAWLAITWSMASSALADQCLPIPNIFMPGGFVTEYDSTGSTVEKVGRECTIQLLVPAGERYWMVTPEQLSSSWEGGAGELQVTDLGQVTGQEEFGCGDPGDPQNEIREVNYHSYLLAPVEPLPPDTLISIKDDQRELVHFKTSDELGDAGCDQTLEPPLMGVCSPGIPVCTDSSRDPDLSDPPEGPDQSIEGEGAGDGGCGLAGGARRSSIFSVLLVLGLLLRRYPREF